MVKIPGIKNRLGTKVLRGRGLKIQSIIFRLIASYSLLVFVSMVIFSWIYLYKSSMNSHGFFLINSVFRWNYSSGLPLIQAWSKELKIDYILVPMICSDLYVKKKFIRVLINIIFKISIFKIYNDKLSTLEQRANISVFRPWVQGVQTTQQIKSL